MAKINIRLWRDYKLGLLDRKLTFDEQIEVDNCEMAMNLLLPTKSFVNLYNKLQSEGWSEIQVFNILCMTFRVPSEVVQVKFHEIKNIANTNGPDEDYSFVRRENKKIRGNLGFWKVYKVDKLNRDLLPLEEIRINECDSVMDNLVPNDIFISIYDALKDSEIEISRIITMLAIRFKVPTDIIEVKIYEYEKGKNGPKLVK